VIGENWPFPLSRIEYEQAALREHLRLCPAHVPAIVAYEPELALLVLEDLREHIIARKAFIRGMELPHFAQHMARFLADTLFGTSDFGMGSEEKRLLAGRFAGNAELCATTESVIFTGPYWQAPLNRHNPLIADDVAAIRQDQALHRAAAAMNLSFRSKSEALIHGDLHTGSIMVTEADTRVIDAEWAFMGPMGFDLGALIGNMLIAWCSQPGHAAQTGGNRDDYADWLLETIETLWQEFAANMADMAEDRADSGEAALMTPRLFSAADRCTLMEAQLRQVLQDTAGFAGAKMMRRVIGISHVEDLEGIEDAVLRARCERHVLSLARALLLSREKIGGIGDILALARSTTA